MRYVTILLFAVSCAGQRTERPNSGEQELLRMRNERVLSPQIPSVVNSAGQESWEVNRREQAHQEKAAARSKQCESDCDARRATCEAQCAEEPQCLSRCPAALPCRAKCP